MGWIEMRSLHLNYNMYCMEFALGALYDIYEKGLFIDTELKWIGSDGTRHGLIKGQSDIALEREAFCAFADSGAFERCSVEGWSDEEHTRRMAVVWNPYDDDGHLRVNLYGGVPFNDAEDKVIGLIKNTRPEL